MIYILSCNNLFINQSSFFSFCLSPCNMFMMCAAAPFCRNNNNSNIKNINFIFIPKSYFNAFLWVYLDLVYILLNIQWNRWIAEEFIRWWARRRGWCTEFLRSRHSLQFWAESLGFGNSQPKWILSQAITLSAFRKRPLSHFARVSSAFRGWFDAMMIK